MDDYNKYAKTIQYDSSKHVEVISQIYGSVWPRVLPHCLLNTLLTIGILYLMAYDIDLTISEFGHEFMSVIVAFLVVSRCTITFSLYFEFRGYCASMFQATRGLTSLATCFPGTPKWRREVALDSMLLLRTACAVMTGEKAWEVPELSIQDKDYLLVIPTEDINDQTERLDSYRSREWVYGKNVMSDLNLRVPILMSHKLRRTVASNTQLDSIQQQQLYSVIKDFMDGYNGVRKYLTTPFPFPLVNMAQTFLFFYVYTLPFALLTAGCPAIQSVALVFIVTYGFLGIEYVSIELEDPFGDDPSDLPVVDEAELCYDDVVLMMMECDGATVASELRMRMRQSHKVRGRGSSERDSLLSDIP